MDSKTYMIKLHHAGSVDVTEVTDTETANEMLEVYEKDDYWDKVELYEVDYIAKTETKLR